MTDDYKEGDNKFTGKIQKVVIEVGPVQLGAADQERKEMDEKASNEESHSRQEPWAGGRL